MGCEFTRRNFLNDVLKSGLYAPNAEQSAANAATLSLSTKSRLADPETERNYDRLMQRIRTDGRKSPRLGNDDPSGGAVGYNYLGVQQYQYGDRTRSLSPTPSAQVMPPMNNNYTNYNNYNANNANNYNPNNINNNNYNPNNVNNNNYNPNNVNNYNANNVNNYMWRQDDRNNVSSFHSRHQQMLHQRRQLELGYQQGTIDGSQQQQFQPELQQQQQQGGYRPTYSVRNIPLRNLEELRETIGIRRQYYRDRLFGKPEGEEEAVQQLPQQETEMEVKSETGNPDGVEEVDTKISQGNNSIEAEVVRAAPAEIEFGGCAPEMENHAAIVSANNEIIGEQQ